MFIWRAVPVIWAICFAILIILNFCSCNKISAFLSNCCIRLAQWSRLLWLLKIGSILFLRHLTKTNAFRLVDITGPTPFIFLWLWKAFKLTHRLRLQIVNSSFGCLFSSFLCFNGFLINLFILWTTLIRFILIRAWTALKCLSSI